MATIQPPADGGQEQSDLAALAKGGRTNIIGFLLRLAARLPFLFIAGRVYGPDVLGRFAYAVLVVEFAAQLATLGLKRGLAGAFAQTKRPESHVLADAMLLTLLFSLGAAALLMLFPEAMFPNSGLNGLDRLFPVTIVAIAGADEALAACAWRYDIAATVRARAIVEPWTIRFAACLLSWYSLRDGLILSYVLAMVAALAVALWSAARHFKLAPGWRPHPPTLLPAEWASPRRSSRQLQASGLCSPYPTLRRWSRRLSARHLQSSLPPAPQPSAPPPTPCAPRAGRGNPPSPH